MLANIIALTESMLAIRSNEKKHSLVIPFAILGALSEGFMFVWVDVSKLQWETSTTIRFVLIDPVEVDSRIIDQFSTLCFRHKLSFASHILLEKANERIMVGPRFPYLDLLEHLLASHQLS